MITNSRTAQPAKAPAISRTITVSLEIIYDHNRKSFGHSYSLKEEPNHIIIVLNRHSLLVSRALDKSDDFQLAGG